MPRKYHNAYSRCATLIRPVLVDSRHDAWNGRRIDVISKFDVLRV